MGDGSQIPFVGRGSIKIHHGEFKNVLYVPSLATNLLSVYQMTHISSPKQVVFGPDSVEISVISIGKIIAKGVANHASKAYEFSHFLPYSAPAQSHLPFQIKILNGMKISLKQLGMLLEIQIIEEE